MKFRKISVLIGLTLAIGVGLLVYGTKSTIGLNSNTSGEFQGGQDPKPSYGDQNPAQTTKQTLLITMSEVAEHNSGSSCWSIINSNVYDLTSWIPNHPGGEKVILSICGRDGSSAYNSKHGGKSKQAIILAGFIIGVLEN